MEILRILSLLLDYPEQELVDVHEDLQALVADSALTPEHQAAVNGFIQRRCGGDLMAWQEEFDGLFERGRSLSMLLFEHVHGESRDRGQAMVDLKQQYQDAGLDIGVNELPDYIPLYLEFLSTQGVQNGRFGLEEIAPIMALLACRLEQRESDYAAIFHALLSLSEAPIDLADLRTQIGKEAPDHTSEALDKVWEEEMVSFMATEASSCGEGNRPSEQQRRDQYIPLNTDLLKTPTNPIV